ncbi:ATP-binding cassette domain-containing protein [Sediminibacterium soli]|uniref:ATP-binding cassette domain-containing protein n=1 Tax=Sediminibacterium soli TaxID=2698829 RepID=UPI00137A361E|nr:ATP-binding cassette domain-containing protein [Sediminibacterium soli]NCI47892.1 ATP-binding cassette domain-containing protein [Sediminibacterium soli]
MTHTLEADGIQLAFGDRKILSDIYIRSETGKITGLLGRNGEGKSCLMKIIYGNLSCEKSVRINNQSLPQAFSIPHRLRYLPQFNFIPQTLTLKRIFEDFELDFAAFTGRFPEFASKYTASLASLPGGGIRLVELYAIAKSSSDFVMLDEPFTHLSPLQTEKAKELLSEEKRNKGIIVTDHMYRPVLDICDNLYLLVNGTTRPVRDLSDIETYGYAKS